MKISCQVTSASGLIRRQIIRSDGVRRLEAIQYIDAPLVELRDLGAGGGTAIVVFTDPEASRE